MPDSVSEPCGPLVPEAFGGGSGACFCTTLDEQQLGAAVVEELGDVQLAQAVRSRWSSAFASWPVFVSFADWRRMSRAVEAVEQVVALPGWQAEALRHAPSIARHPPQGAAGAFFGFDFHVDQGNVGLIEINTNAGGALVNTLLARAQRSCCAFIQRLHPGGAEADAFEAAMVEMFRTEWRLSKGQQPLRTIAIVDESPESQYLYPEFLLLQRLLERHQIRAMIADPGQLSFKSGTLRCDGNAVDLVYNRLNGSACRHLTVSLPRELSLQEWILLAETQIARDIGPKPYQYAIHNPHDDAREHPHAHIIYSDRVPDGIDRPADMFFRRANSKSPTLGGCKKDSGGQSPKQLKIAVINRKKLWADVQNQVLEAAGHAVRVDYRSCQSVQSATEA